MGRKPRIEYYGAIYHIVQMGNSRKPIFEGDGDKEALLEILSETKTIYDFNIYAYVIMNDHYHLLIKTLNIPVSRIMHGINARYARYYNYSRDRTGPVFDRRYRGILVQDESCLLTLIRYIHNDPVVANICDTMEGYQWSSDIFYRINMESIVDIEQLLDMLSEDRLKAIDIYIDFMANGDRHGTDIEKLHKDIHVMGTDGFKRGMGAAKDGDYQSLDCILKEVCPDERDFKLIKSGSRRRYLTKYKRKYIELARNAEYSYGEIGANIGITKAAVSHLLKSK